MTSVSISCPTRIPIGAWATDAHSSSQVNSSYTSSAVPGATGPRDQHGNNTLERLSLFDSHFHSSNGSVGRGGGGPSFPRAEEIARRHWSTVNQTWVDHSHPSS